MTDSYYARKSFRGLFDSESAYAEKRKRLSALYFAVFGRDKHHRLYDRFTWWREYIGG